LTLNAAVEADDSNPVLRQRAAAVMDDMRRVIEVGTTLEDLALTIHPHPTLSEGVHDAADHGLGRAVHVLNRRSA
jgi:dihydrolipoamide dehydrogenase